MIGTILGDVDMIIRGLDVETCLGSLDGLFDDSNDGKLDGLFLVSSLWYTHGKVLGSDKGIKLWISFVKVLGTMLWNVYGITLGLDIETELGSLDGSFDGFHDEILEVLFLGESLGNTDG